MQWVVLLVLSVQIPLSKKIIAGGSSGAIASFICVPCDLMKVSLHVKEETPTFAVLFLSYNHTNIILCLTADTIS